MRNAGLTAALVLALFRAPVADAQDAGEAVFIDGDVLLLPAFDDPALTAGDTAPEDLIEIILPASPPTAAEAQAFVADEKDELTVSFPALPRSQLGAMPIGRGQPEPSILVGLINPNAPEAGLDEDDTAGFAFEFTDDLTEIVAHLARLRELQAGEPALFATLLDTGMLDPPGRRLMALALQTELARMNCYGSRIDGQWGDGSVAGARAYLRELAPENAPGLSANAELFRLILRSEDVTCPTPAVAAPRSSGSGGTAARSTGSGGSSTTAPARSTTTAPRASTPTRPTTTPRSSGSGSGGIGGSGGFGGVFR